MIKRMAGVLLFLSAPVMAVNTTPGYVNALESRDTGYHGVWLSVPIPEQGCTNSDRAVIVESDPGSKTQTSVILAALAADKKVIVGVSGCTDVGAGGTITAPRVVKVQINRN